MKGLKYNVPVKSVSELADRLESSGELRKYIAESSILVPELLLPAIEKFIKHQNLYGSAKTKAVYRDMTVSRLVNRLFSKRPLVFVGPGDMWVLKTGESGNGGWESVGSDSEKAPLIVRDLLSYEEICLSSFISVSVMTPFINTGSRYNSGVPDDKHEREGVCIGQVGARFEKPGQAEWRFILVTRDQNTELNGYGPVTESQTEESKGLVKSWDSAKKRYFLKMFAELHGVPYFPTFKEASTDRSGRFIKTVMAGADTVFFDTLVYTNRVRIIADLFLKEANYRAASKGRKAFCHVVGLGLGAWSIKALKDLQVEITVKTYIDLLKRGKFTSTSDLYFAWFGAPESVRKSWDIPDSVFSTRIHFGIRDPAENLGDPEKLLVCNWAWDPNSYVGNEFWLGKLSASGDPATACCTLVPCIGNPDLGHLTKIQFYKYD